MQTITRNTGAALIATTVVVAAGGTAYAQNRTFTDRVGDATKHIDITQVRVFNGWTDGTDIVVRIRTKAPMRLGDNTKVFYNTESSDPGPEFRFEFFEGSEYRLLKTERWGSPGQVVECSGADVRRAPDNRKVRHTQVPRSCLDFPGSIQVAVRTGDTFPPRSHDWTKGKRNWLGLVQHGQ